MADKKDYTKRTPGEIIRSKREDMNLSQFELSMMIGKSRQQISRIELNASNPTIDTVVRLENVLDVSLFPAFITFQKQKNDLKPNLFDIILMIVSKQDMTESELKILFDKIVSEYTKRKI